MLKAVAKSPTARRSPATGRSAWGQRKKAHRSQLQIGGVAVSNRVLSDAELRALSFTE